MVKQNFIHKGWASKDFLGFLKDFRFAMMIALIIANPFFIFKKISNSIIRDRKNAIIFGTQSINF